MSGGGFRGRGFGHRGGRSKGPANGFGGPRFPRPNFNRPRPPHSRLPNNRPDNWLERPRFVPWQRPQFRGNSQFRPNARGRSSQGPGRGRFPGHGRPPGDEFFMGYVRNVRPTIPFQEQVHNVNKIAFESPAPLPGSEEERQQKISETADKLKQKLSSITEEDLTNLWEDDSSILPSSSSKVEAGKTKGIPELKHHPPELNLTFTDFRDIGRVDCNNARYENLDDVSDASDDVVLESTNFKIVELNENERGSVDIIDLEKDIGDPGPPLLFLDDDNCHGSQIYEPFGTEHNSGDLELSCSEINDNLVPDNFADASNGVFVTDVDNTIDFTLDQPLDGTLNNLSMDFSHTEDIPGPINIFQNQDVSEENIIETQDVLDSDVQQDENVVKGNLCQTENTWQTNNLHEVVEGNLCQTENTWQTNDPQEVVEGNLCQTENTWQTNNLHEVVEENLCQTENTWQTNDPQEVAEGNLCQTENTWQKNDPQEIVKENLCQSQDSWQANDSQELIEENLCHAKDNWQENNQPEVAEEHLCEREATLQENDSQNTEGNLCQPQETWEANTPQEAAEKDLCQAQDSLRTDNLQEENEISKNIPVLTEATLSPPLPCDEEEQSNTACDTQPVVCSPYTPQCISEKDEELNSSSNLHPRTFNEPPRFGPRIPGPRCHWNFQQNSQNSRFPGGQRFPIHRSVSPPRHATPFVQTDLVPVVYDSRAPPPYSHNILVPNHDSQHNSLLPYSPNDLTPSFSPSKPPPNVKSIVTSETSSSSETMQPTMAFDSRNASSSTSPKKAEIFDLPPAFDPRGPPPTITSIVVTQTNEKLSGFNHQHPPPMIINKEGIHQPPPMFDAQLPSPENAHPMAPMSQITDFSRVPLNTNYSQPPPIGVSLPQTFIPNMQMNFQAVLQPTNINEVNEVSLPTPVCLNKESIPPLPLDIPSDGNKHLGEQQTINMEDGLEDLRKAMEFANEVMHMGGEEEASRPVIGPVYLDMPLPPSEMPALTKESDVPHSLSSRQLNLNKADKSKKTKNKLKNKGKQDTIYNSEALGKKREITEQSTLEIGNARDQGKSPGDELPPTEHLRPKVVFNLNSKIKKINAVEEWNHESEETRHRKQKAPDGRRNTLHQIMVEELGHTYEKDRLHQSKLAKNVAAEVSNNGCYQRNHVEKSNDSSHRRDHTEKSNDVSHCKDHTKKSNDLSYRKGNKEKFNDVHSHRNHAEQSHSQVSSATSTNVSTPKRKKMKQLSKKIQAPISESTWKARVINRFLKMSKNDICNMVNNSGLRKFDIAMKHLVKEGRPSLSLKLRNTEDEKMKEYDREEFMSQLNAMLDPGAVVAITDLPTEFIHHLSEVLQLDPMPADSDTFAQESAVIKEPEKNDRSVVPNVSPSGDPMNDNIPIEPDIVYVDREITKVADGNKSKCRDIAAKMNETPNVRDTEEFSNAYYPVDTTLLDPGPLQEEGSSSKKFTRNRTREERETIPKKQQLLFNEDDLDNILSEVTQRTKRDPPKSAASHNLPRRPTHVTLDTCKNAVPSTRAEIMKYKEASPQIRIRAAADLDDIFSAGIARAKRKTARSDNFRSRKSTSEDRNTIRTEKYERWSKKERENPDTFRNLTKEEWEARYARPMSSASSTTRRSGSNSSENLNRERRNYTSQRYCSSDSPMRHLSISPLGQDHPPINIEKYSDRYEQYEESRMVMRTVSSSDSTFSSTESSDTTVAPDVTKLLKVIKEKEKIAKTKSLNETIRDEVAAEIEMKWREKSKHKERKCRKREKRKRDKRDRRRKEKRRKRRRSCTSSDRSDVSEEHRLLTENEIKKEVIVKEEQDAIPPVHTSSDNVISPPAIPCMNATAPVSNNLHNESHGLGTQKQLVPIATCNPEHVPVKNKPITSPIQPKTKAQLKQMPESSDMVQKIVIENSVEGATNKPKVVSVANVVQNELRKATQKCKNDEVTSNSKNEQECNLLSTNNNSLQQTDAALTVEKSQRTTVVESNISEPTALTVEKSQCAKIVESNISEPTKIMSVTTDAVSSSVNRHLVQQCTPIKLTGTSTPGSTENKGGSKKIDIKAYKERALRRQLKEQTPAKEISSPNLSPHIALEVAKVQSEPLVTEKQVGVTEKDKIELALVPSYDRSNKEGETISTLKDPRKRTHSLQQSTELPDLKNKEIGQAVVANANLLIAEHSDEREDTNINGQSTCSSGTINESSSQGAITDKSETGISRIKMQSKSTSQEKLKRFKKPTPASDPSKFKNIRSEGGKELKLKKEKVKKLREIGNVEQTNEIKSSRVNTTENRLQAKHSLIAGKECAVDAGAQKLSVTNPNIIRDETDDNVNFEKNDGTLQNLCVPGDSTTRSDENTRNFLISAEIDENRQIEEQADVCTGEEGVLLTLKDQKNILKENTTVASDDTRTSDILCVFATVEGDNTEESAIEENLTNEITLSNKLQSFVKDSDTQRKLEENTDVGDKVSEFSKEQVPVDGEQYTNKENNVQESADIPVNTTHPLDTKVNAHLTNSINSTNSDIQKNNMDNSDPVFQSSCDENELESTSKDSENVLEHMDPQTNGTTSPDSIDSPFKGFLAESIEDNICKVSMIANIEASVEDIKEELMANSKKWKLDKSANTMYGKNNTTSEHAITDGEQSVYKLLENEQGSSSTINTVDGKLPGDSDEEATIDKDTKPGKNNISEKEDSVTTKELKTNEIATAVANNVVSLKERKGDVSQEENSATIKERESNKTPTDAAKVVLHVKGKKNSMREKGDSVTTKQLENNGATTYVLKNKLNVKSGINSITKKENSVTMKALETNETAKVVVKDILCEKERENSTLGKEDSVAIKVFEKNKTDIAAINSELKTKEGRNSILEKEDSVKTHELETNEAVTATAENDLNVNKGTESISEEEHSIVIKDFETNVTATEEDSQNTSDKDSEQFITLDEYLDETEINLEGTSSAMELNSENYSLRNQDNLLDTKLRGKEGDSGFAKCDLVQVSSSMNETKEKTRSKDAKTSDLGNITGTIKKIHAHKVKQKNTAALMDPSSSISFESDAEQSLKSHVRRSKSLEKSSKSMDSNVREVSTKARKSSRAIEREKSSWDTITKEAPQELVGAGSLCTEVEKTEEKNFQCNHKSKNNVDSVKVPKRLHVPTKAALKKSVDIVVSPVAHTSITETNASESLELKPAKQVQNSEKRNDDTRHSRTNDGKFNDNVRTDGFLQSSDVKLLHVNSLKNIPVVEIEKSKILDDMAGKKQKFAESVEDQLVRSEEYDALRKIKHKPKMKHKEKKKHDISEKKIKDTVISGNVQFRDSHSKEAIMARMIEIDVEIHKLMTEKMTLYQMLKTDALPFENTLLSNDATCEIKETESVVIPSPTPAVLVSQLIQNIETNPVVTGHPIIGTVGAALKENRVDSPQPSKHKESSRHEHNSKKRDTPCYSSDDEEVMHYTEATKFSDFIKRKKHKSEKNVTWNSLPVSSATSYDISSTEKKKSQEITKSVLKKVNNIGVKETMEPSTIVASIAEVKVQGIVTEAFIETEKKDTSTSGKSTIARSSSRMDKTITELTDVQDSVEKRNKSKALDSTNKCVSNDNQDETEILNENATGNSETNVPQDRTPERSSIYSDESTWESFQNAGSDTNEQKRPSTGLALLEKSYKKEMERSRKMKAEALKKKHSRDVSKTVVNLTIEEEELPLSKLYTKKVRRSKDLPDTVDQKGEKSNVNEDPQFWRNALAVIDAVAEDRVQELYTSESAGESKEDSGTDTVMNECDIPSSLVNVDQLNKDMSTYSIPEVSQEAAKENVSLCTPKNIEEPNVECVAHHKGVTSNETVIQETEDPKNDDAESVASVANLQIEDAADDMQNNTEFNPQSSEDTLESSSTRNDVNMKKNPDKLCVGETMSDSDGRIELTSSVESTNTDTAKSNTKLCHHEDVLQPSKVTSLYAEKQTEEQMKEDAQVPSVPEDFKMKGDELIVLNNDEMDETACIEDVFNTDTVTKTSNSAMEDAEEAGSTNLRAMVCENQKLNADNNPETSNPVPKTDYPLDVKEFKESQNNAKESERSTDALSKDNFNGTHVSISSRISENTDTQRNEDSSGRKSSSRKRRRSKAGLRRSSRYTEENSKRMKLADDTSTQSSEQDVKEKSLNVNLTIKPPTPLTSHNEETDTPTNIKKIRGTQKLPANRKQAICLESETSENPLITHEMSKPLKEATRQIKKRKQYTMLEMMSCRVSLIDSKYTILRSNVNPEVLNKLGISRINEYAHSKSTEVDSTTNSLRGASMKELNVDTKRMTSVIESKHNQFSKLSQNSEDAAKMKKMQKASKQPLCPSAITHVAESSELDIQVIKEQITVDASKVSIAPEIEIVEEKKSVTKSQVHDDPGTTLPVIESKDDKELSRTQYTVHKGPILDIKVFESSFLAASEDGRIYRYSQASNGILNIYKGHKSAVTCLYVYSTGLVDHNKNWMFSGSLDGTLRCYNITTGGQMRDTADVGSPIQCMDQAWGVIFVGTKSGHVSRYHIKSGAIKGNSIQFSDKSVLALKATNEGPRRVLIVASRSQPITIRDAQSGLFLRTICGERSHTVYSLMRHHNFIYCGTSSTSILVFDFTNGDQTTQYDAGVGIVCMRLYKQLLFAGCYDGNIYVFDTKDYRLICSIPGPGNMLLSMEIIDNKIIAGSKDKRLQSWLMPRQVRALL